MNAEDEQRQLAAACRDLVVEFGDQVPESDVAGRFTEIVGRYDEAPIRTFIPVLAQREARAQLRQLAGS